MKNTLNILLFILCLQQTMWASVIESPYPLGGIWRSGLFARFHQVHLDMAKIELQKTTEEDFSAGKFTTNVALCQLNVYLDDGNGTTTTYEILNARNKIFLSGGYILLGDSENFIPIVNERDTTAAEIKKKKNSIATQLANLSKLTNDIDSKSASTSITSSPILVKLDQVRGSCAAQLTEYEGLKEKAAKITAIEEAYEAECVFTDPMYEYKNHLYDSEQVIIRHIDRNLRKVKQDNNNIIIDNQILPKSHIKGISLHIHSRFDMCPYCLESLRRRIATWSTVFNGFPFNIVVSSRQEYIPNAMILYTIPKYQGTSMRYIGIDEKSKSRLKEEELAQLQGFIVQVPLFSWDLLDS